LSMQNVCIHINERSETMHYIRSDMHNKGTDAYEQVFTEKGKVHYGRSFASAMEDKNERSRCSSRS
jgi:hypothetical protein